MVTVIVVALCVVIGVLSVVDLKGDNPIENAASAIINKELGTDIDISDIMEEIHKPIPAPATQVTANPK